MLELLFEDHALPGDNDLYVFPSIPLRYHRLWVFDASCRSFALACHELPGELMTSAYHETKVYSMRVHYLTEIYDRNTYTGIREPGGGSDVGMRKPQQGGILPEFSGCSAEMAQIARYTH